MLTCTECSTEYVYKLISLGRDRWACSKCYRAPQVTGDITLLHKPVSLGKDHYITKTTKAEIAEIRRNRLLPGSTNERAIMGRLDERGRLSDRSILGG